MTRKIPIPAASFALVIAAAGFLGAGRAPAAESRTTAMQVISSDATARFVPLAQLPHFARQIPFISTR